MACKIYKVVSEPQNVACGFYKTVSETPNAPCGFYKPSLRREMCFAEETGGSSSRVIIFAVNKKYFLTFILEKPKECWYNLNRE
jgi:hypothetical protein